MRLVLAVNCLAIALASSCMPMAGQSRPSQAWPTQTYRMDCSGALMPSQPSCLYRSRGFDYAAEFAACRSDMESFARALDRWCECVLDDLVANQRLFVERATATLDCLHSKVDGVEASRNVPSVIECPIVDVTIDRHFVLEFHDFAPSCVKEPTLLPGNRWALDFCNNEVLEYARKTKRAVEASSYRVRQKAQEALEKATRVFNCHANRERFCF